MLSTLNLNGLDHDLRDVSTCEKGRWNIDDDDNDPPLLEEL